MKSQGRASEPAQAKIGTRRLEKQPEKGKAVETADSPVRHTVRLTTADRETKSNEDMKHCWVDHGSNQVVHDWAKKKSLKQGNAGWKAEKAWLCFTEK
ncbi:hypothetical protein LXL04_025375 [Taraxacum kok-saghyz]